MITTAKSKLISSGIVIPALILLVNCNQQTEMSEHDLELRLAISFTPRPENKPLDGRIIVILVKDNDEEPRFQVASDYEGPQIFGIDVEGLAPGTPKIIDSSVFGFPVDSLADVPPGDYFIQAVLHKYETFELANGVKVKLPPDQGEGQQWAKSPGNLYSAPQMIHIDPDEANTITIIMDQVIESIEPPLDTPYVKHIKIKSELLTKFWGRPTYLGAHVLLPEGFEDHPESRFPLMVFHGHFPEDFAGFQTMPPDPKLECERSERYDIDCYNRIEQQEAYDFYRKWSGPEFPRMLIIQVQHANPYYDDSYAVNSANLGPYGDAITYELIPYIEATFQGIGEGWARFLYGGSTGGWVAMAVQVFYPDEYNGTFAACPDPIDFRAYTLVNLYQDNNAYYMEGPFAQIARPGHRDWLGHVNTTMEDENHMELVLGSKNRSGGQWDIWEAVFSPMGSDGYPKHLWDKKTGVIDHEVAEYWRDNYDLMHILRRDWVTLGPKLKGKLHIYAGDMDNFYLNNAVYLAEEFLEATTDPYYAGEIDYGDRAEHCWNGDHKNPNAISRLRYNSFYLTKILKRIEATAPEGADLTSWRY